LDNFLNGVNRYSLVIKKSWSDSGADGSFRVVFMSAWISKSQNITVNWRRSASLSCGSGSGDLSVVPSESLRLAPHWLQNLLPGGFSDFQLGQGLGNLPPR